MKIKLFGRPYNRTDRVQWTLEELGLRYEYRVLDVFGLEHRKPEFRALYGLTRLPFVELDGRVLFESGAIMIHLAERFRARKDLLPATTHPDYPEVLQWLWFANSTLDCASEAAPADAAPSPQPPLVDVLGFLDSVLHGRRYVASDRFTIADIALANNLKYFGDALDAFPRVRSYFDEHTGRPAFRTIAAQPEYANRSR